MSISVVQQVTIIIIDENSRASERRDGRVDRHCAGRVYIVRFNRRARAGGAFVFFLTVLARLRLHAEP